MSLPVKGTACLKKKSSILLYCDSCYSNNSFFPCIAIGYENLWKLLVGGSLLTLTCSGFVFPKICIFVAPSTVSPEQSEMWLALLRETERKRRWGKVQEITHSKDKHSLLFSHTFHRAMIMEQILADKAQWISATGFQIGDVWGRVSRVQCTWPSSRVVSSAFLPSALQAINLEQNRPRNKLFQNMILPAQWELALWLFYDNWTWMDKQA